MNALKSKWQDWVSRFKEWSGTKPQKVDPPTSEVEVPARVKYEDLDEHSKAAVDALQADEIKKRVDEAVAIWRKHSDPWM